MDPAIWPPATSNFANGTTGRRRFTHGSMNSKRRSAEFLHRYPGSVPFPEAGTLSACRSYGRREDEDCYVQDPSTAFACEILRPSPEKRVLDACAAPGGKTAYLAEMMANQGLLVAADQDELRLARLRDNLVRLGVTKFARCAAIGWTKTRSEPQVLPKSHSTKSWSTRPAQTRV